jgi:hypothetical protein
MQPARNSDQAVKSPTLQYGTSVDFTGGLSFDKNPVQNNTTTKIQSQEVFLFIKTTFL